MMRVKLGEEATVKTLDDIHHQLAAGQFEFCRHAFKRAIERNVSDAEIRQAGAHAQLIEDYPMDKYAPSGLILGFTERGRPLHLQVSYMDSDRTKIITLYEPNEREWSNDFTQRR